MKVADLTVDELKAIRIKADDDFVVSSMRYPYG